MKKKSNPKSYMQYDSTDTTFLNDKIRDGKQVSNSQKLEIRGEGQEVGVIIKRQHKHKECLWEWNCSVS